MVALTALKLAEQMGGEQVLRTVVSTVVLLVASKVAPMDDTSVGKKVDVMVAFWVVVMVF